jgi:hypothetical protein
MLLTPQGHSSGGLVDHVYGLVRQLPIVDVASREIDGRLEKLKTLMKDKR